MSTKNLYFHYIFAKVFGILITRRMEGQTKKLLSITIALLLGAGIILFAWKSGTLGDISFSKETTTNKDLLPLSVLSPSTKKRTLGFWKNDLAARDLSTSTTDVLVYDLITSYASAKATTGTSTRLSSDEVTAQAQALAGKVKLPPGHQYKTGDLNIINDNSLESRILYAQKTSGLIRTFIASQTKGDLVIIFTSPNKEDTAARDAELEQNISHYKKLQQGLLGVAVPSNLAKLHLGLLQSYSNMQYALLSMKSVFNDPVKGLAALTQYRNAIEDLLTITKEYQTLTF